MSTSPIKKIIANFSFERSRAFYDPRINEIFSREGSKFSYIVESISDGLKFAAEQLKDQPTGEICQRMVTSLQNGVDFFSKKDFDSSGDTSAISTGNLWLMILNLKPSDSDIIINTGFRITETTGHSIQLVIRALPDDTLELYIYNTSRGSHEIVQRLSKIPRDKLNFSFFYNLSKLAVEPYNTYASFLDQFKTIGELESIPDPYGIFVKQVRGTCVHSSLRTWMQHNIFRNVQGNSLREIKILKYLMNKHILDVAKRDASISKGERRALQTKVNIQQRFVLFRDAKDPSELERAFKDEIGEPLDEEFLHKMEGKDSFDRLELLYEKLVQTLQTKKLRELKNRLKHLDHSSILRPAYLKAKKYRERVSFIIHYLDRNGGQLPKGKERYGEWITQDLQSIILTEKERTRLTRYLLT